MTSAKIIPLSFMTPISPVIKHHIPSPSTRDSRIQTAPKLILVLGWMEARDLHLAKYITKYQSLYPTSQILLIKCPVRHMIFRSQGALSVKPAVDVIRAALEEEEDNDEPELLIHLFSDGGSAVLGWLYAGFEERGWTLPKHNTVFDSAPGEWGYAPSFQAMITGVPVGWKRILATPLVHLLCLGFWVAYVPWARMDPFARDGKSHNDASRVREGRRSYVYGDKDELVLADSVERHAADAVRRGFEVRLERFRASTHCAHMMRDPERYWRVVGETWEALRR